jgi:hypothetical protein
MILLYGDIWYLYRKPAIAIGPKISLLILEPGSGGARRFFLVFHWRCFFLNDCSSDATRSRSPSNPTAMRIGFGIALA